MLVCSGTMPTFEPLTTKQTNLALCSTIQTGFIDRRIAATRSNSGSSRAGDRCCGGGPGCQRASSKGRHRPGLPASRLPPREPSCLLGESTEEGVGHGACKALLTWPSLVQLLSSGFRLVLRLVLPSQAPQFGCCSALGVPREAAPPERSEDPLEARKDGSGSCLPLVQSEPWTLDPAGHGVRQAHVQ